jgi:hypothetical protein
VVSMKRLRFMVIGETDLWKVRRDFGIIKQEAQLLNDLLSEV